MRKAIDRLKDAAAPLKRHKTPPLDIVDGEEEIASYNPNSTASVVDRTWASAFSQQFRSLFRKNALLAWRNRKATILRLASPFIFVLLVWLIDKAIQAEDRSLSQFEILRDPEAKKIDPIPSCEEDMYILDQKCYDLYWTADTYETVNEQNLQQASNVASAVVEKVMANNDPPIPAEKVRQFKDRIEVDEELLKFPETCIAAVHFYVSGDGKKIDFTLQTNSSVKFFKGKFQHPNFFVQLPLQNALEREIARYHLEQAGETEKAANLQWEVAYKEYPHPAFDTLSIVGSTLGPFLFAANMFSYVAQIAAMVSEKQQGMKQALRTMGMLDSAYWLSWAAWETIMVLITTFLIYIFGMIFQFKFFTENDFGLVFLLFFLFQLAMSGMGFVFSVFLEKAVSATLLGFVTFLIGWITQAVVQFDVPYTSSYFDKYMPITVIFTLLPWNLFAKGTNDLGKATSNAELDGLTWSQRSSYCRDEDGNQQCEDEATDSDHYIDCECVMPLSDIYWIFLVLYLGYFLLAMYLDKIIPNESGVSLPPWFFLQPGYWGLGGKTGMQARMHQLPLDEPIDQDIDVHEEEQKMKGKLTDIRAASGQLGGSVDAVEVFGLQKVFHGANNLQKIFRWLWARTVHWNSAHELCGSRLLFGNPDFQAIKGSWFSIEENQLFCLLGPNGAGKTTTINCLTGVIPPSGGDAVVYGEPIQSAGGMDRIRSKMGVCPQFDVLWSELTGQEHLEIFGNVKGLLAKAVASEAMLLLERVKLTGAAKQTTKTYSGGMKRRLSVAISLLGNPKIVYLDEPTTGMDPISRRYVWDIIEAAKPGRAIILTTHSMEEADILGDKISIMARGQIRAIGSSIRLKQKYGAGYEIDVSVGTASSQATPEQHKQSLGDVKQLFKSSLGLDPRDENRAYITYLIPRACEQKLPQFLTDLESAKDKLNITDVQISLTTLEEVFLAIARQAEIEALQHDGITHMTIPFMDGSSVLVPLGQTTFQHPTYEANYEVKWGQNESGRLVLDDIVPIGDVPDNVPVPNLADAQLPS